MTIVLTFIASLYRAGNSVILAGGRFRQHPVSRLGGTGLRSPKWLPLSDVYGSHKSTTSFGFCLSLITIGAICGQRIALSTKRFSRRLSSSWGGVPDR